MDPPEHQSQVQRVVVLVDAHPLLRLPDPAPYLARLLSAARASLSAAPLATHRLFLSSLSPVLSTARLHRLLGCSPSLLSFDVPASTLLSLSGDLHSLAAAATAADGEQLSSRASLLAASLLRLEHDYGWEPRTEAFPLMHKGPTFRPNLVLLFSPSPRSLRCLSEYVVLEADAAATNCVDGDEKFLKRFRQIFDPVKERFVARDIHLTWIDVDLDQDYKDENFLSFGLLKRGLRELGWGFCSADAITLGSVLIPFGLISPYIGCNMRFKARNCIKHSGAELVLEIMDVSGKPLECKVCDLEAFDIKPLRERWDNVCPFSSNSCSGQIVIRVKDVWRGHEGLEVTHNSSTLVLLCEQSVEVRRHISTNRMGEFIADKVLELLCREEGVCVEGQPVWQLLLAFLYRQNYCTTVSISYDGGETMDGILKPFTINSALLCIAGKNSISSSRVTMPAGCKSCDLGNRKKRSRTLRKQLQDLTWTSFCDAVFNQADAVSGLDLEDIYFSSESKQSKKLRFLKCWMNQKNKSSCSCQKKVDGPEEPHSVGEGNREGFGDSQQDPEVQHLSSSSAEEASLSGFLSEESAPFNLLEDAEAFIKGIPEKIEHGLCSEEVEISDLAERLVRLCIHALLLKSGSDTKDSSDPKEVDKSSRINILSELCHLLLRKPKDLASKYKGTNPVCDPSSTTCMMENKVREHELQILFRMEILQSEIRGSIEEILKQKIIKEVCSLLQNIEFNLEGDLFHGESLVKFAGRIIKSRYSHSLGDVIHKIYSQMEFFSFDEDDVELSESLPNSNSDESQRVKDFIGVSRASIGLRLGTSSSQVTPRAGTSCYFSKNAAKNLKEPNYDVQEKHIMKAQERRDRDRRFSSFTSWMPDLQRVWALKQPRAERAKSQSLSIPSKRRKRQITSRDVVRETPMSGKEHSKEQRNDARNGNSSYPQLNSYGSLSKALFQSEEDA